MEIALAKTNEAIANISISIANLTQEIDSLKSQPTQTATPISTATVKLHVHS